MQWHSITRKTTYQAIRTVRDMTVEDMSTDTTIDVQATEEEVDSFGIVTSDHVDPSSALPVIRRGIGTQTVRIKTELSSNFVLIVEYGITH